MKCTFYRPTKANRAEYENIIGKLHMDLKDMSEKQPNRCELFCYLEKLVHEAHNTSSGMAFYEMDDPSSMPSDCRVEYVYKPTYIAASIMMRAALLFPELVDEKRPFVSDYSFTAQQFRETISAVLLGCTGRDFNGSGWDSEEGFLECMEIFEEGKAEEFVRYYYDICPAFSALYTVRIREFRVLTCTSDA